MGRYLPQLDGLRALAALLVIGLHLRLIPGGYIGVDVFFVLSGYLITSILLSDRERGRWSLKRFYGRRLRRLYPALLFMLIVTLPFDGLLMSGGPVHHGLMVLSAATYTSDFVAAAGLGWPGGLVHTWSLAVEEQFYLLWPLGLCWALGRPQRQRGLLCATGLMLVLLTVGPHQLVVLPVPRGGVILLGCLLALAMRGRRVRRPTAVGLTALAGVAAVVLIGPSSGARLAGAGSVLAGIASVGLIAGLVAGGPLARAFSVSPMVWLGKRSYALYLWHFPIMYCVTRGTPSTSQDVLIFSLSVLMAAVSYRLVEQPFRNGRLVNGGHRQRVATQVVDVQ